MNQRIHSATIQGRLAAVDNPNGLKSFERDKLKRVYLENYVWGYATRMFAYALFAGAGGMATILMIAYIFYQVQVTTRIGLAASIIAGIFFAGVAAMSALDSKSKAYDEIAREYEHVEFADLPRPEPDTFVTVNGDAMRKKRRSKQVVYQDQEFVFSGRNLDRLLDWYEAGGAGKSIRRDKTGDGPGFRDLPDSITSSDYSRALFVLKGRGLIDNNNAWTSEGVEFLQSE